MTEIEDHIKKIVEGMEGIYRDGKKREKQELTGMIKEMDWFKNFLMPNCKSKPSDFEKNTYQRITELEKELNIDY